MAVVDRFSKSCCFIPHFGLPASLQVAEALFQQDSQHYGLPEYIVSDRSPQFTSRVWKAFMEKLGVHSQPHFRGTGLSLTGRWRA